MPIEALWGEEWSGSSANWDADWGEAAFALGSTSLALAGTATLTGTVTFATGFSLGSLTLSMAGHSTTAGDPSASLSDFWIDAPAELPAVGHVGLTATIGFDYGGSVPALGAASIATTGYIGVAGDVAFDTGVVLGNLTLALSGTPGVAGDFAYPFELGALALTMTGTLTVAGNAYGLVQSQAVVVGVDDEAVAKLTVSNEAAGMNGYMIGEVVRCTAAFTTPNGTPVEPASVTFRMRKPDGTTTVYIYGTDAELLRDDVGEYRVDFPATLAGRYHYRFESGGTYQAAAERGFRVQASRVT